MGDAAGAAAGNTAAVDGLSVTGGASRLRPLLGRRTRAVTATAARTPTIPTPMTADLPRPPPTVVRPIAGRVPEDESVEPAADEGPTAMDVAGKPPDWRMPEMRSTECRARAGAKGQSAMASSPTLR